MTDRLSIEVVRRRLDTKTVGRHLYLFGEIESTNRVLRRLARSGAAEGTAVLAESQSDGRARLGRAWFSPAGVNLYVSVLFRHGLKLREVGVFSFTASLALSDAVKELGLSPAIKWPNDVLVGGKKVAGSLAECASRGEAVDYLVLGVGVNLNVEVALLHRELGAAGLAATSLAAALGHPVDRNAFAASYLTRLDGWALRYFLDGPAPLVAAWRERDILTGRRVEARSDGQAFAGRALGIDEEGHLLVRTHAGDRRVIVSEEIRVLD